MRPSLQRTAHGSQPGRDADERKMLYFVPDLSLG
jgi:hypothetical protein